MQKRKNRRREETLLGYPPPARGGGGGLVGTRAGVQPPVSKKMARGRGKSFMQVSVGMLTSRSDQECP